MKMLDDILQQQTKHTALKNAFLRWQCRTRQIVMREAQGKPDNSILAALSLPGADEPMGHVVTVLNKLPHVNKTAEMRHMVQKTMDPAARRSSALTFFSETYFQKSNDFSDVLCASFSPGSQGANDLRKAGQCRLDFSAYNQSFSLHCKIWKLTKSNPLWAATYWHNHLFNPNLSKDIIILGFEPDWSKCSATPAVI